MSAQTLDTPSTAPVAPVEGQAVSGRAGFGGALASEWVKIRSVSSTVWTLSVTVVLSVGFSILANWLTASDPKASAKFIATGPDWGKMTMAGLFFGQLAMAVFGVMAITTEYSTGMIRSSLTAQPRRMNVFWAKLGVLTVVSLVLGEIITFSSFLVDAHFWSSDRGIPLSLSTPHILPAVIGAGLYLAGVSVLAFGMGAILRHTAGAITTAVGVLFVLNIVVNFLPQNWQDHIDKWLPSEAGGEVMATIHTPGADLGPWTGFGVFMAYAVGLVILGAISFDRRDA